MRTVSEDVVINNLKIIRTNMGISQETVAQRAGIARDAYRRIENWQAQPSGLFLLKIAKALKLKPDTIFFVINSFNLEKERKKYKIREYKK